MIFINKTLVCCNRESVIAASKLRPYGAKIQYEVVSK